MSGQRIEYALQLTRVRRQTVTVNVTEEELNSMTHEQLEQRAFEQASEDGWTVTDVRRRADIMSRERIA